MGGTKTQTLQIFSAWTTVKNSSGCIENYGFSNVWKATVFLILFSCIKRSQMFREIIVILRDAISRAKLQRMIFSTTEKSICYECYNFTAAHQDDKHEWRNVEHQTPFLNGFTLNLFFGYTLCYAWESFLILPHSSSRPHNWITNYKEKNQL